MMSDGCKHVHDEFSFIWCVLYSYFVRKDTEDAVRRVSSMYEHGFSLTPEFEELLYKLWGSSALDDAIELAKRVLEKFVLSTTDHVVLIAFLVDSGQLTINNASRLLQTPLDSKENLNSVISHALDVAWLTNEDEKDELMNPDADGALSNALKDVKASLVLAN